MSDIAEQSTFTILSGELINFRTAMQDVQILLNAHDSITESSRGRPDPTLEVYKRSALILAVTAWETFIEDTIKSAGGRIIDAATKPSDVSKQFNHCAASWSEKKGRKPHEFEEWCGDGWKKIIREKLQLDVDALNTPKSNNIADLAKRYLKKDITAEWRWRNMTAESAKRKLNALISLRGELVHRGRGVSRTAAVKRSDVDSAINFLPKLVERTELALGRGPRPSRASEPEVVSD